MTEKIPDPILKELDSLGLQRALTGVTVGGAKGEVDLERKGWVFAEYVSRAFPAAQVLDVQPIDTAAALNSVSGIITLQFDDQRAQTIFGKVHIESNTRQINPLGAEQEYENAEMLARAGWPVLEPLAKSNNPDYPLLLYPVVEAPPLFDKLEESHISGKVSLTDDDLASLERYNEQIGKKEVASMRIGTRAEAFDAPVQTLLLRRFESGGRIDQWYTPTTPFKLPGMEQAVTWSELLDKTWEINGKSYDVTLRKIVDEARNVLSFEGETEAYLTISHGDDHAGNVRLTEPPVVFDPAFAGWNPAALDLKALAHTGFLPMAAMYYSPKGLEATYSINGQTIVVATNVQKLPTYAAHEDLAKQIIDTRITPLLEAMNGLGANIPRERQRIESGLAGCALLTVNIAELLNGDDGRAVGLLPMAVMFHELSGLPMLEYLRNAITRLEKELS